MDISSKINIISGKGVDNLNEKQKQLVNRLLNEYYKKIHRMLKNFVSLQVNIKDYEKVGKEDKEKKFSIHIMVNTGGLNFEADAADWDLARALHKSLNKVINEIEHKMHSSNQYDKIRSAQNKKRRLS